MIMVMPDGEPCTASYLGPQPRVMFQLEALRLTSAAFAAASGEVAVLGWVERETGPEWDTFVVQEAYLPGQEANGDHVRIPARDLGKLVDALRAEGAAGEHKVRQLRYFAHSHGEGGTTASLFDAEMVGRYQRRGCPWLVRVIGNRRGELSVSVYLFAAKLAFQHVPYGVLLPGDAEFEATVAATLAKEVRMLRPTVMGEELAR